MHLPIKVIRKATIIIQATEICAADVAHLQFLMSRGSRGVRYVFQFALASFLLVLCGADFEEFGHGKGDGAHFAKDRDFEEA